MSTMTERSMRDFDHPDRLNEDGTVTLRMQPSNWRAYNISPDTYQTVNGDSWVENELDYLNNGGDRNYSLLGQTLADLMDEYPVRLDYDHFKWTYNHAAIVQDFAETLALWIFDQIHYHAYYGRDGLRELEDVVMDYKVLDSWSPQFYNFQSDGFEMELTVDPVVLRRLTPDFDLDDWATEHYRSVDGFMSFVTSRINDDHWAADYDGQFRVEYLLAQEIDPMGERGWIDALVEDEYEVYMRNTVVEPDVERIRESILKEYGYMESGYTLAELEAWAREITAQSQAGVDPLL